MNVILLCLSTVFRFDELVGLLHIFFLLQVVNHLIVDLNKKYVDMFMVYLEEQLILSLSTSRPKYIKKNDNSISSSI